MALWSWRSDVHAYVIAFVGDGALHVLGIGDGDWEASATAFVPDALVELTEEPCWVSAWSGRLLAAHGRVGILPRLDGSASSGISPLLSVVHVNLNNGVDVLLEGLQMWHQLFLFLSLQFLERFGQVLSGLLPLANHLTNEVVVDVDSCSGSRWSNQSEGSEFHFLN